MADSEVTTTSNINADREFFTYCSVFSELAESVKKHDPQLFVRCANMIDMSHATTLRGLSYLGFVLAQYDEENTMQRRMATDALAELSALMACMIEFQNEGELIKAFGSAS